MKALRFVATFVGVAVIVTVASVTAAFMIWSVMSTQPGTITALFTLFIFSPGAGVAVGLYVAAMGSRKSSVASQGARPRAGKTLLATLVAITGFLAGFGGTKAAIDMTFTRRWEDPASASTWLPFAPPAAGIVLAIVLSLLVVRSASR